MSKIKTMIAGAALTLGAGIAIGQPTDTPASDNAASPAEPATPATPADPSAGTAAAPATPATPATAATPATPAAGEDPLAPAVATTEEQPKPKKARKKSTEVKVGKPRD